MMYVISTFLPYFFFFISNIFENFKFGRNFSKFTAGMGCRLVAVSVKIGGNRRLQSVRKTLAQPSSCLGAAAAGGRLHPPPTLSIAAAVAVARSKTRNHPLPH
jgi:hypothetical protein